MASNAGPSVETRSFGTMPDGREILLFTLRNRRGSTVEVTNYGAIVVAIRVPDRSGTLGDVVLGHDDLDGYLNRNGPYFGATIGRCCNRIRGGRFLLEGREVALARNDGENHIHGGFKGFDRAAWTARSSADQLATLELHHVSRDLEEGYPGTLAAQVTYSFGDDDDDLRVEFTARTDRTTVCNLAHHSYFNLDDGGRTDILHHRIQIEADRFTVIDQACIPSGEIRSVEGTPLDFTSSVAIGERIHTDYDQVRSENGYNHNYVLRGGCTAEPRRVVRLEAASSGRFMEVLTTEPGLQFYSGNLLDGRIAGKGGCAYARWSGLCLETQHFPDSPNHRDFPSIVLRPGETYRSTTIYRFGAG